MRIAVALDRCEGHARCAEVAPAVYDLDDDAVVVLRYEVVPAELERQAESGARACPVAALRVEA